MPDNSEEEVILNVNIVVNGQDQLAEVGAQMDDVAQQVGDAAKVVEDQLASIDQSMGEFDSGLNELVAQLDENAAQIAEEFAIIGAFVREAFQQITLSGTSNEALQQYLEELRGLGDVGEYVAGVIDNLAVAAGTEYAAFGIVNDNIREVEAAFAGEGVAAENLINRLIQLDLQQQLVSASSGGETQGFVDVVEASLKAALALVDQANALGQMLPLLDESGNVITKAADANAALANAAGGAVPPLNNLNVALGSGGESFNQYAAGLEFMAKALNNTQASLQNTIDKQVEDISRSLAMTRAIYEVAAASNTQKGALKSLEATADSLAGRLRIAEQAQDALRATFSASRSSLDMYGLALVTIGEAYAKLNTDIAEDVIAQIQQTRAALAAEQALLAYAQASGQSAASVSILEQNVASLMEKLAFQREQLQVVSDAWQLYGDDTRVTEQALIRLTEGLGTNSNVLLRQIQDELRAVDAQQHFATSLLQTADSLGITGDAYDALSYKVQTLTDNHFELERAQLLLQNTIERSNATYRNEGIALLDLSDRFTALDGDVRKNVDAQLEQVTTAQDATQRLLDYASANKFTAQVVAQLATQYEALSAKADQLRGQQRMLNEVFGEEAPQMLRAYDEGLQYLAEQLNNASLKTTEEMQAELESVQARIQAAEALWRQADAAGASQSALNSLQDTIDSLTDKEHILAAAIKQVNDAAIQTPSEPTAPPGESPGGPGGPEGMAQQNAFMMMMFAQRVMQLTQQFIALGAAADTSLAGIQAEMGLTQQATDGLATQLQGMAVSTGYGLNTLADGLKTIMEAGFNASEGLQVLQASAELARATSTNLATTTATLSSVMDTFHLDGTKAALTANQLMVGAQAAHQTVQAFATSLSQVAEDAVAAHVSFAEVASAEAVLSVRFGSASTAASTLSTLLHAVSLDADTVSANVQKAGLSFDATKFQTLDWAGKLEYLNTLTHGNAQEIQQLIGGSTLLQQAMSGVGLSTQQLAANAVQLGLSFDAAHYNSLSLAGKLQYLLQVSGGNEKTFQALMGGAANLNQAFQHLQLNTNAVATQAQHLGLAFDATHFKSESLIQKLRDLWAISGHNVGVFQSLVGGAKQADAALALIGGDGGAKYNQTMTAMDGNTRKLDTAFSTAMGSMGAKMGQLTAMIQNMSYQFLEAIKPQLTAFLTQLSGWVAILGQHMNIVMPIVAGLAIALGVVLIAALAPLIGMLAGIIAGAAPFIVIGAAIGAAAVLIYQNWSRVAPVLAPLIPIFNNVAHAITGFVQLVIANLPRIEAIVVQVFHQIVGFLVSTFFPVWQQLQSSFVDIRNAIIPLMPMIMRLGQALLIGIGIAVVLVIAITAGLIRMFAGLLIAVMQIVTGIIQFFSGFIQTMSSLLQFFVDLFSGKWQNLARDLNNVMMGIVEMFLGAWNMVKGIFTAVFAVIVGFAQGFSSAIVAIFTDLQSILVGHSIIPDMANSIMQWFARLFSTVIAGVTGWVGNVVSWFGNLGSQAIQTVTSMVASLLSLLGNLWTQGVARVQSLASGIMSILSSLPGQAMTWGADMISSFIGGIQSMAGSLMGAIGNIAGSVAHMLGFSKPDMGPLARSDEWMPDFGDLLEKGLLSNVPKLRNASQQVALALSHGIATPQGIAPTLTATAGNNPTVSFLAQILATLQQQGRSQTGAPLTSSSLTQQIGSVNFHGIRDLQSAYAQFNAYSGLAQEYANRGATAGLPL